MNPLFFTAIRAAKQALDEIKQHEYEWNHPMRDQSVPAQPSLLARVVRWFHGKRNR